MYGGRQIVCCKRGRGINYYKEIEVEGAYGRCPWTRYQNRKENSAIYKDKKGIGIKFKIN